MAQVNVEGSLRAYVDALASPTSAPGGGSAAALAGALGVGLFEMVAGIHAKRTGDRVDASWSVVRGELLRFVEADAVAFAAVMQARKGQGPDRDERVLAALKHAVEIPLGVCAACQRALAAAGPLAEACRLSVGVDLAAGAELLGAAFRGARVMAQVNLRDIPDAGFAETTRDELERLRMAVEADQGRVLAAVRRSLA